MNTKDTHLPEPDDPPEDTDSDSLPPTPEPPALPDTRALFYAFLKEVLPDLLERLEQEDPLGQPFAPTPPDLRAALLEQESEIERHRFTSNAVVRVLEGYHAVVVNNQRIPLDHKQGIVFRALVERHLREDYTFLTAAELTTLIATEYRDKLWTNLEKSNVVQVYSRLRLDIRQRTSASVIEHNGERGTNSGYRLSTPAMNIILPDANDCENR